MPGAVAAGWPLVCGRQMIWGAYRTIHPVEVAPAIIRCRCGRDPCHVWMPGNTHSRIRAFPATPVEQAAGPAGRSRGISATTNERNAKDPCADDVSCRRGCHGSRAPLVVI